MSFEAFLDGLNKGGFAFLGMVLVAAILIGGAKVANWLTAYVPKAWAELNQTIKESSQQQTVNLERALQHSDKLLEQQAMRHDTLMVKIGDMTDAHKTIFGKLDTVIDKLGDKK